VETAKLTATQIAVIYGVPPEKLGGTTGNTLTYTNVEAASIDYLMFSLRPWLVRVEAALSTLFPRGTYVKFDTTEMLRTDAKTRAEIDAISLGSNPPAYRTPDEVRADHDWAPLPKPPPVPAPAQPAPLPDSPNGVQPPSASNGAQPLAVGGK
jgi:HK97 family phage portal protein